MRANIIAIQALLLGVTACTSVSVEHDRIEECVGAWIDNSAIAPQRRQESLLAIVDRLPYMSMNDRGLARQAVARRVLVETDVVLRRLLALIWVASGIDGCSSTESLLQILENANGVTSIMVLRLLGHRGVEAKALARGIVSARFGERLDDMVTVETSSGCIIMEVGWDIQKEFCKSFVKLAGSDGVKASDLRMAVQYIFRKGTRFDVIDALPAADFLGVGDIGDMMRLRSALEEHDSELRVLLDAIADSLE